MYSLVRLTRMIQLDQKPHLSTKSTVTWCQVHVHVWLSYIRVYGIYSGCLNLVLKIFHINNFSGTTRTLGQIARGT